MSIKFLLTGFLRVIVPLTTTTYASLKSQKSDLSIDVLNLICLLGLYLFPALPDWPWTSTHVLVINLDTLTDVVFVIFVIPLLYGVKTILSHQ